MKSPMFLSLFGNLMLSRGTARTPYENTETWVYLREKCSPLGSCAVVAGLLQEDSSVDTTHPWSTPSEAHEHSVSELTELLGT